MGQFSNTGNTPGNLNGWSEDEQNEDLPLKFNDSLANTKRRELLRILAVLLCFTSVFINLILSIVGFIFATIRHSPATFAFAVDCVLDLLSSVIVIWRYFGSPRTLCSPSREAKACISLGILFIVAGVGVILEGSYFLYTREAPKWFVVLVVLAAVGCCACVLLGLAKYFLGKKLNSEALFLDALNSLLSSLFAMVIIISNVVYLKNKNIWYLDPMLSIILSVALVAIGTRTISLHYKHAQCEEIEN